MTIAAQQNFERNADIFGDLPQENRRDIATLVKRNCCRPSIRVSKLFVGTALSNFTKTKVLQ
jgi:hypothetical protein